MSDAPQSASNPQPEGDYYPEITSEAKNWAVICHLTGLLGLPVPVVGHVVGPLVVWLMKRDDHPFIDDQGKEAVNFQITMVFYELIAALSICIVIGIVLLPLVFLLDIIFVIIAAIKASSGEPYRYPLTIRLIS
jgi:uncharacterized Tic20 family protein